jgi:hypothetical protein
VSKKGGPGRVRGRGALSPVDTRTFCNTFGIAKSRSWRLETRRPLPERPSTAGSGRRLPTALDLLPAKNCTQILRTADFRCSASFVCERERETHTHARTQKNLDTDTQREENEGGDVCVKLWTRERAAAAAMWRNKENWKQLGKGVAITYGVIAFAWWWDSNSPLGWWTLKPRTKVSVVVNAPLFYSLSFLIDPPLTSFVNCELCICVYLCACVCTSNTWLPISSRTKPRLPGFVFSSSLWSYVSGAISLCAYLCCHLRTERDTKGNPKS